MIIEWPLERLENLFQGAKPRLLSILGERLTEGELLTPRRQAYFLAQTAHETLGFRLMKELGSKRYLSRYEGRVDLGNTQPGDGVRFCGRGIIMLTGRANYQACGEALNLPLLEEPELLERPEPAVRAALWFWRTRTFKGQSANQLADAEEFTKLTRLINGGLNGLESRRDWLQKIEAVFNPPPKRRRTA